MKLIIEANNHEELIDNFLPTDAVFITNKGEDKEIAIIKFIDLNTIRIKFNPNGKPLPKKTIVQYIKSLFRI